MDLTESRQREVDVKPKCKVFDYEEKFNDLLDGQNDGDLVCSSNSIPSNEEYNLNMNSSDS